MDRTARLRLIRKLFGYGYFDQWLEIVRAHVGDDARVLEIGAGSGRWPQNCRYPTNAASITGIDLDPRVLDNPHLHTARVADACKIAEIFAGQKFDVIYSHMVAEHIGDAERFLTAQAGLLADGGVLIHSTVSTYFYTSVLNRMLPARVKFWLIRTMGGERGEKDVFPAFYRLNTAIGVRNLAARMGLECRVIRYDHPPGYLSKSLALMLLYSVIHRPLRKLFPALNPNLVFVLRPSQAFQAAQ